MPKITRTGGASYTDPETGEPMRGPEGLQVIPTEGEPASHYDGPQTDEHGEPLQLADTAAYAGDDRPDEPVRGDDADRPQDHVVDPGELGTHTDGADFVPFDPGQHTVADVQAYLADCDDPAERERVLNTEAAGKNRTTIMTGRAAGFATEPAENTEE